MDVTQELREASARDIMGRLRGKGCLLRVLGPEDMLQIKGLDALVPTEVDMLKEYRLEILRLLYRELSACDLIILLSRHGTDDKGQPFLAYGGGEMMIGAGLLAAVESRKPAIKRMLSHASEMTHGVSDR